ncbi:MAG: DUF2059 domain-containing protein [Pseudoxanthomonas sp.]
MPVRYMLLRCLLPRLMLATCLALSAFGAGAAPPSDQDIERLLTASRAQGMLDAILPQMEAMQRQQFEQITAGKDLSAEQKAEIERLHVRTSEILRRSLSWQEMRPLYIDVYKKTFSREDVRAMAKFYESPAGKSLLDKTPALMQNLMGAVQQKVLPLLEDLKTELDTVAVEPVKAPAVTPPQTRRKKKK